jgi:hypothetical protein
MGKFAKTTFVDYRLSFAGQGKQTSVFRFRLQQTKESLPFPFSVCRKQTEVAVFSSVSRCGIPKTWRHGHGDMEWRHRHGDMETWTIGDMGTLRHGEMETWRHGDMNMETSNGKGKPRHFS